MESPPLKRFLQSLGKVQQHLHAVVVGLSAVERGIATKPDDLDIAWKTNDLIGSSREARRFVLRATLIFVAEELQAYALPVLRYKNLTTGGYKPPEDRADRIRALAKPDEVNPSYLFVAPLVVSHWRNRIVHRDSKARLTAAEKQLLTANADAIRDGYKAINVAQLLQDFELDKPTLKDTTVLLAMSVRFLKQVDATLPLPTNCKDVRRWLEAEDLLRDVLKLEKDATSSGHPDPRRRARQYLLTKAPGLAEPYYSLGVSEEA